MKGLRGTVLDPFGHTEERRLERELARDDEDLVEKQLLPALKADSLALAVRLALVVQQVRGFGAVKLANLATARAQWTSLMDVWRGHGTCLPSPTPRARRIISIEKV